MSGPVAEPGGERRVTVQAGSARYEVVVGAGVLGGLAEHISRAAPGVTGVALVADAGLPRETVAAVERSLRALRGVAPGGVATLVIEPSEPEKSLATLERVCAHLAAARLERRGGLVVALGGGIVGDIAGFAAATYRRGVRVVQCPTTLLAMVDASVGGKTGVNLAVPGRETASGGGSAGEGAAPLPGGMQSRPTLRKNFVGAFHQPALVVADVATLDSLPDRDFRCGLAECFKHGLLSGGWGDADLFAWTEAAAPRLLARDRAALVELVARNVAIKAAVVASDERETAAAGGRALLNLGHTFAHAIEPIPGAFPEAPGFSAADAPLRHGEAVALGLVCAGRLSAALGRAGADLPQRIERALTAAGLPTRARGLPPSDQIRAAMGHDKKAAGGRMRLVIPLPGAQATVIDEPAPEAIDSAIESIRGSGC